MVPVIRSRIMLPHIFQVCWTGLKEKNFGHGTFLPGTVKLGGACPAGGDLVVPSFLFF